MLRARPRGDARSVSPLFISRLCRIPGCARGGRTTRPRGGIYQPSSRSPSALQGEVPLGNALVVVAKEGRRGAFGQVGEFRRLFPNPLRSRWAGHLLPPLHPVPPRMTGLGIKRAPIRRPTSHIPRHDPTSKGGVSGCRNAAVGANFRGCCAQDTVCLGEHFGEFFPVCSIKVAPSSSRLGCVRRLSGGMTVRECCAGMLPSAA
jgi:hypothetical protein